MNASFNKITASVALIIAMGASAGAMAAQQASLQVTGTIKPGSCDISFNGGSVLDYGDINVASLNKDKTTDLAVKSTKLNIDCTAPTLFAVRSTDLVEGAGPEVAAALGSTTIVNSWFSLGKTEDGQIIGGYRVVNNAKNSLIDNAQPQKILYSTDEGSTWNTTDNNYDRADGKEFVSWDTTGTNKPSAAQNVSLDISITPTIVAFDKLGNRDEIKLGGNTTFDVVYL